MASRAFDSHHPPDLALIDECVHCGFCLETCPTYALWHEEMDSPRGRIVLMRSGLEEGSELSAELVTHMDRCLGCMACVTACPSGVQYDKLIEATRPQIERRRSRPWRERLFRRALFATFTHPARLRALVPMLALRSRPRIDLAVSRMRLAERLPWLGPLVRLAPPVGLGAARARLPALTPAHGERRGCVAFMQGCVQRVLFHDVNQATVETLAAEGFEVAAPELPRCCGALQLHSGEEPDALDLAREAIGSLEHHDRIVVNAAGCGSAMKEYGHLLRDDPDWAARAAAFSAKVRDVTELLAEAGPRAERRPVPMRVAYHDACHLAHAQGVRAEPRGILREIPGLELVEPEEWEICCGSAGVYNVLEPEPAAELGRRKVENLVATGVEAVAVANPGCALQIRAHSEEMGTPLRVFHPLELLRMSIGESR